MSPFCPPKLHDKEYYHRGDVYEEKSGYNFSKGFHTLLVLVLSIGKNKHLIDTTMSKDVKFNINLSVNGKDVVVQCKQGIQELGKALGTIPSKAEQGRRP